MTCRAASVAVSASLRALSAADRVEVNCNREGAVDARWRCLALTLAAIALNKPCTTWGLRFGTSDLSSGPRTLCLTGVVTKGVQVPVSLHEASLGCQYMVLLSVKRLHIESICHNDSWIS